MDWIDTFMEWTDGIPSTKIFRQWAGITTLSGALERRVWMKSAKGQVYPNLYTMLIGPPAAGKSQSILRAGELWGEAEKWGVRCAPNNLTKAALVDALAEADRPKDIAQILELPLNGTNDREGSYHVLLVPCSEFGVFLSKYDLEFLSVLTDLYDNPKDYKERRRTMEGRQPHINEPSLTMLIGTQPDFLATLMPSEAWGMGFMSRVIMVYASTAAKVNLFDELPESGKSRGALLSHLQSLISLHGPYKWDPTIQREFQHWYDLGMPPVPEHSKLLHYRNRRHVHIMKLCMIASASRGTDLKILEVDYKRAKRWLEEAEALMPDVFRAMFSKSDMEILQELHYHLWNIWAAEIPSKREPVQEEIVYEFLQQRIPTEKISKLVEVAEKSGLIQHSAGGGWIPKPLSANGVKSL